MAGDSVDWFGWLRNWPFSLAPSQLSQAILPNWSLFSVTSNNSTAPETERRIVEQDSYGRQLGRIMDALEELIRERPHGAPLPPAYIEFAELKERIDKVKAATATERLNRVREDLRILELSDHEEYERQAKALKAVLRLNSGSAASPFYPDRNSPTAASRSKR